MTLLLLPTGRQLTLDNKIMIFEFIYDFSTQCNIQVSKRAEGVHSPLF